MPHKVQILSWNQKTSPFYPIPKVGEGYSHITVLYNRLGNFIPKLWARSPTHRVFTETTCFLWELLFFKAEAKQLILLKTVQVHFDKGCYSQFCFKTKGPQWGCKKITYFWSIKTVAFTEEISSIFFFRKDISLSHCHKKCFCPTFLITSQNIFLLP